MPRNQRTEKLRRIQRNHESSIQNPKENTDTSYGGKVLEQAIRNQEKNNEKKTKHNISQEIENDRRETNYHSRERVGHLVDID